MNKLQIQLSVLWRKSYCLSALDLARALLLTRYFLVVTQQEAKKSGKIKGEYNLPGKKKMSAGFVKGHGKKETEFHFL